jgi:hypothetical protein
VTQIRHGHCDSAEADLHDAVRLGRSESDREPANVQHRFNLVVYQVALGEWSEAKRLLLEALGSDPAPRRVAEVMDDLVELSVLLEVDKREVDALIRLVEQHQSNPLSESSFRPRS